MKCLVTGASSGIGKDICKELSKMGHEVIMVSKDRKKLEQVSKEIKNSIIFKADLTNEKDVDMLLDFIKLKKPDMVVNNAGFGAFGFYDEVDTKKEIDMIMVNVLAVHRITKTCLSYMGKKESYILNVASMAGLMPGGPLLNTYYATKAYVRSYTLAINKEIEKKKKPIHVSVLCPGPVDTNFNKVAGGTFRIKPLTSEYVAKYALKKTFENKKIIIPGFTTRLGYYFSRFLTTNFLLNIAYYIQNKKIKN